VRRDVIFGTLFGLVVLALVAWIANNTTWVDVTIPMPPKGEARSNPFYAQQRFAEALGARTTWDRTLQVPPSDAVIVLSDWHWSLSTPRRDAIKRWVESGGRLVVDRSLLDDDEFEAWSGIVQTFRVVDMNDDNEKDEPPEPCHTYYLTPSDGAQGGSTAAPHTLCSFFESFSYLTASRNVVWMIGDKSGAQVISVRVGRGRVTTINSWRPFHLRELFEGDHGWLFVEATGLRRGDVIHFLSEFDHPSMLALMWQYGAPVVLCAAAALVLGLWRGSVRFGPLAPMSDGARRSLAEQIRGSGQFAAHHDGGDALHAACVRALEEAASRRVPGYRAKTTRERIELLAQLTGYDRDGLSEAIHHARLRREHELADTIARLESARRRIVDANQPRGSAP
jgi:hypothetical protein